MERVAIAAALWLFPIPLCAQWLNLSTPGIPRTAKGKPNLMAPVPRTPDGTPDLSGMWQPAVNSYRFDVIQDLKEEGTFRPEAEAVLMRTASISPMCASSGAPSKPVLFVRLVVTYDFLLLAILQRARESSLPLRSS